MKTTVVGGGIVGLACAFELAELGVEVTVLDSGPVGGGASAGNAGWVTPFLAAPRAGPGVVGEAVRGMVNRTGPARIRPHPSLSFARWVFGFLRATRPEAHKLGVAALQRLAADAIPAYDRLAACGVDFEEYRQGLVIVARTAEKFDYYRGLAGEMQRWGYGGEIRVVAGREAQMLDPAIHRSVAGAVHLLDERHVRPESVARGLAAGLRARGARIAERAQVTDLARRGGGWQADTATGERFTSDNVVVAAGFGSRRVLRFVGVDLPLESARGTSMTVAGEGVAPKHPLKLADDMVACSPFGDRVRLSGAFDLGVRHDRVDRRRLDAIVGRALRYLEDWRPVGVDLEWTGSRPTTPDDLPAIGPAPGHDGLYVATGHGTLGMTLGPVTGRLVARELVEQDPQPLLAPFRLTRFTRRRRRVASSN